MRKRLSLWHLGGAVVVLAAAFYLVNNNTYMAAIHASGAGDIPDLRFGASGQEIYRYLAALGDAGRRAYLRFLATVDIAFPLAYTASLLVLVVYLRQRVRAGGRFIRLVPLAPFVIGLFDIIENLLNIVLIRHYPERLDALAGLSGVVTVAKWLGFALYVLTAGVLVALAIREGMKRRS
jgi:hypothetical protein